MKLLNMISYYIILRTNDVFFFPKFTRSLPQIPFESFFVQHSPELPGSLEIPRWTRLTVKSLRVTVKIHMLVECDKYQQISHMIIILWLVQYTILQVSTTTLVLCTWWILITCQKPFFSWLMYILPLIAKNKVLNST